MKRYVMNDQRAVEEYRAESDVAFLKMAFEIAEENRLPKINEGVYRVVPK